MSLLRTLPFALALLFVARPATACMHVGPGVTIEQRSYEALALHHESQQELVLKPSYRAGAPIEAMGMVLPVPNAPLRYTTLQSGFFASIRNWVRIRSGTRMRSIGPPDRRGFAGVVELEPTRTGPYDIQPIRGRGPESSAAVRQWLTEHGFAPIPVSALEPYARAGWTFVTVRIAGPDASTTLATEGELPPLQLSFQTPHPVFPVRLEAQGRFPMWLYLITSEALSDDAFSGAVSRGFTVAATPQRRALPASDFFPVASRYWFTARVAPEPLRSLIQARGLAEDTSLYLRVLHARRFGQGQADPRRWSSELTIPETPDAELVGAAEAPSSVPTGGESLPREPGPSEPGPDEPSPVRAAPTRPPDMGGRTGGCGCRVHPQAEMANWLALGTALVALAIGRRRRSQ